MEQKYTVKEALEIIAKHMKDLAKTSETAKPEVKIDVPKESK